MAAREGIRGMTTKQLVQQRSRLAGELEDVLPSVRENQLASLASERIEAERIAAQAEQRASEIEAQTPRRHWSRNPELASERARAVQARERASERAAQGEQLNVSGLELAQHAETLGRYVAIGEELDRRRQNAARAAAIEKPAYLTAELGPYPEWPSHRRTWERAAIRIEMYRESFGVIDEKSALGKEPREHRQRDAWRIARRDVDRALRELGRAQARARDQARGIG